MVKLKSPLMRGAKGKLAGTTIYTSNGETVAREIVDVKNPQTIAQVVQRVIAKTVNKNYAAMKRICDHSFEGKTMGAKCMSRFLELNLRSLRERAAYLQENGSNLYDYYNFMPLGSTKYMPAAVIIAEGSLPGVACGIADGEATFDIGEGTYDAIVTKYGLQRGDQLTFCTVEKDVNGNYRFYVSRVILDPRNADGSGAAMSEEFMGDGTAINLPNARNQENFEDFAAAGSTVSFKQSTGTVVAAGIIVSRKADDYWFRSNCKLVLSEAGLGDDLTSLMDAAFKSKEGTPIYTESAQYLNNAGTGGTQGSGSEAGGGSATQQLSNTVRIRETAGQSAVSQDISGGSVTVNSLNSVIVTGTNLNDPSDITIQLDDGQQTPFTVSGNEASWTYPSNDSFGDGTAKIRVNGTLWFIIEVEGQPIINP